jgi:hypothetical protein
MLNVHIGGIDRRVRRGRADEAALEEEGNGEDDDERQHE